MPIRRVLVVDNYDSFTFNLVDLLRRVGAEVRVARARTISARDAMAPDIDAVVVSPGPGEPRDAGVSVEVARLAVELRKPYLGVCLGHQALAVACGGEIVRARVPAHGTTVRVWHERARPFTDLPSPLAEMRYNSLTVCEKTLPPALAVIARSDDDEIMALAHEHAPAFGVQFHPESFRSELGDQIVSSFLAGAPTSTEGPNERIEVRGR